MTRAQKFCLKKIRAEKAEKIKNGELKADKKDSFIFVGSDKRHYEKGADGSVKDIEDEIPFELPAGWAWCRLGETCTNIADIDHKMPSIVENGRCYKRYAGRRKDLRLMKYKTEIKALK